MFTTLSITKARKMAREAHGERRDKIGFYEIDHIERVALAVSEPARPVAWLHDAVEDHLVSFRTAYTIMDSVQFYALLLVTREPGNGLSYAGYIEAIRDAPGISGGIAREIKNADLDDNISRPCPEHMRGMREPGGRYHKAKALLNDDPISGGVSLSL